MAPKATKIRLATFQAERGLLACLLNYPEVIGDAGMPPARFFREDRHQKLAAAIFDLAEHGMDLESMALASHPAMLGDVSAVAFVEELRDLLPARESWKFYAEIIGREYETELLRSAIKESTASLNSGDLGEARTRLISALDGLTDERSHLRTFAQLHRDLAEAAEEAFGRGGEDPGISLPWPKLNEKLGGLGDGELSVIAGVPGGGKSVFALQVAERAALRGPTLVFSLEMRGVDLAARSVVRRLRLGGLRMTIREVQGGRFQGAEEWQALIRVVREVESEGRDLVVDDSPALTVSEIAQRARAEDRRARERTKSARGLRLIVVDYAQLVQDSGTYEARHEEIANAVLGFKALARRLNCPVLLLSQFDTEGMAIVNRGGIPDMSKIAGSKDIGKHTDVLVYLLWEKAKSGGGRSRHEGSFYIDKNRQGALGSVPFYFDGERMEFLEIDQTGRA